MSARFTIGPYEPPKPGQMTVRVRTRLPFWWRPYFWLLCAFHNSGMIVADPEIAAAFIMRHARVDVELVKG